LFLFGSKDSLAADAASELDSSAASFGKLDFDGREGPLTAVRALEMYVPL
jgi:hypothetical protein